MHVIENSKLAIVGAGAVGTSLAYAAVIRGSAREVSLYDVRKEKVEAEVLDLAHGAHIAGSSRVSGGEDIDVVRDANVVVVTAGARQSPGQSRRDLAAVNIGILRELMPQLVERAPRAVFILVTNPCDVLAVAAQRISGLPTSRVFASGTVLDTSRLRWRLATEARVSPSSVHAMIIGEHGDSQFPVWSQARVGPVPILEWQPLHRDPFTVEELDAIAIDVKNAAYRVIEGKGATNYSIGLAGARIVEAVLRDEGAILPVSSVLTDYCGVSGLALAAPCVVDASGVSQSVPIPLSAREHELFLRSADAVRGSLAEHGLA